MGNEQEKLREYFEKETSYKCWSEPIFNDVLFSDKYVKWLEIQLIKGKNEIDIHKNRIEILRKIISDKGIKSSDVCLDDETTIL